MRREIGFAARSLRRRPLLALGAWSVPEALPTILSGLVVARALDDGFLAGRPDVGLAWLAGLMAAAVVGAVGSRQVYRRLGDLAEPFRDDLVRRVVGGALRRGVSGAADDGAVARLTRQVEIVRDRYAGIIVMVTGFVVTVVGVATGLASIAPVVALLILPPFFVGLGAFVATLGLAAHRYRRAVRTDERLAAAAGAVLAGRRDVVARGAESHAEAMVAGPIRDQAAAERGLAALAALRAGCFALGGWVPLVVVLLAGPWLVDRGLTAGAIIGGLTYVLVGLQPALRTLIDGLGGSGLQLVVTLGRILDAAEAPPRAPAEAGAGGPAPAGHALEARGLTFAYGPHSEPVLEDLDLAVPEGDHLAIVGPSGIGKSTLAGLLCGLLRPGAGEVRLGGVPVADLAPAEAAALRVLIPQEAYVFTGSLIDNVTYLRPGADPGDVERAVAAVGAESLVQRLGGLAAQVAPSDLSAGERQLIALVRAYLSPAPVAVLDEATSHLDPVGERRAEEAFAARGGTLVVIAHRISSALRARRVLVLDGASAQVGDHATLAATSALYRELLGHWEGRALEPEPAPATERDGHGPRRGLPAALRGLGAGLLRLALRQR